MAAINSNTLTPYAPEYWSNMLAVILKKTTVFRSFVSFRESATLSDGDVVHRPYRTQLTAGHYTKSTALEMIDLASTDESLTINKHNALWFFIDSIDLKQMKKTLRIANAYITDAGDALARREDAFALYEVVNAVKDVDDADITTGGTADTNFTLTSDNVDKVFAKANQLMNESNVKADKRYAVISPAFLNILQIAVASRQTALGDKTTQYQSVGNYWGMDLYVSNNLTFSAIWTPANNPTTAATITIDGVVCKILAALSGTASTSPEFHLCSDTENTLSNISVAINAPRTAITEATDTGYQLPTEASLKKMDAWASTVTATALTVYVKGGGDVTVATSEALDPWTEETAHTMFGRKDAIDMVIQKKPSADTDKGVANGVIGMYWLVWDLFGIKTFNKGTYELIDVLIAT